MQRIPDTLFDAAASGDLDALWALDAAVAQHDLLDETLHLATELMAGGDVGARFLAGWLSIDAGESEAEVAELLGPAADAGHAMARAMRGDLLARAALVPTSPTPGDKDPGEDAGEDEDADEERRPAIDREALAAARELMRSGAEAGAPAGLVFLVHSHLDEYLDTEDPQLLTTARELLDGIDPPLPTDDEASALTTSTAATWGRLGAILLKAKDREGARECHQHALRLGNTRAINDIGATYDGDPGSEGYDRDEATRWYRRAVEADDPMGAYNLGTVLWEDAKATSDPLVEADAEQLLRVAADEGNLNAWHNLGQLLAHRDDATDAAEGELLLREASDRGHLGARFSLTHVLKADASRLDEAEQILRELIEEHDHVDALNDLALMLWKRGTDESVAEAETLYRQALEHDPDDAIVLLNLGVLLRRRGRDDEDVCRESRSVTERAAELGDLRARYNLGNWYRDHDRFEEAAEHYRTAVAQGHVAAHCDLAGILDDSDDPADLDEAERLYRLVASEHDHALSMNNLGVLLLRRDGDRSRDEAHALIQRSAEAGDPMGVAAWGKVLYQQGEHDRAREWLTRGAREGSERAAQLLGLWDDGETEYLDAWGPPITGSARRD